MGPVGGRYCRLIWALIPLLSTLIVSTLSNDNCQFKKDWAGKWFISGVTSLLTINSSWIESKGICLENHVDKYKVHDQSDNCYRCMVIHEKHPNVLQYKETFCSDMDTLENLCNQIPGDAILYSMFRVEPQAVSVPCPFKGPPFTFTYSRGNGECGNPVSRVDSCTDESRLSLKYQACHDVQGTESTVEELQCIASWKDGNTRYMVGKIYHHLVGSDEELYRCFVYERIVHDKRVMYSVAQSGDATCNGLTNAQEGSKTFKLTKVENSHTRCKYPTWITDHHRWHTLDYTKSYHFSHKNATLRVIDDVVPGVPHTEFLSTHGPGGRSKQNTEKRVVCHAEILTESNRTILTAHVTSGCDSGFLCIAFYRRDDHVIEMQQSEHIVQSPEDACSSNNFNVATLPFTTLITGTLPQRKCPHLGHYQVLGQTIEGRVVVKRDDGRHEASDTAAARRSRRQITDAESRATDVALRSKREGLKNTNHGPKKPECDSEKFDKVNVGCSSSSDTMEFHSSCNHEYNSAYSCFGSWEENGTQYLIASPSARKSNEARRYCFVARPVFESGSGLLGNIAESVTADTDRRPLVRLMLSAVAGTCDRTVQPGLTGIKAFNLTIVGQCAHSQSGETSTNMAVPSALLCLALLTLALTTR